MTEVEMTPIPTALDKAKQNADSVLEQHKDQPNITKTISDLNANKQSGEFQADTYKYITKADFDALNALTVAYNNELSRAEDNYYRTQLQILTELLSGIKGAHPEFSGGSKKRSKKRSKKSRSRRTISRRRSRARR